MERWFAVWEVHWTCKTHQLSCKPISGECEIIITVFPSHHSIAEMSVWCCPATSALLSRVIDERNSLENEKLPTLFVLCSAQLLYTSITTLKYTSTFVS